MPRLTVVNLCNSPFDLEGGVRLPAMGSVTEDFSDLYAEALKQSPGVEVRLPSPDNRLSDARKAELLAAKDGNSLASLRDEYRAKFGKRPFMGWDAGTLREKIANG